jgi:hypothetical protein
MDQAEIVTPGLLSQSFAGKSVLEREPQDNQDCPAQNCP